MMESAISKLESVGATDIQPSGESLSCLYNGVRIIVSPAGLDVRPSGQLKRLLDEVTLPPA